MRLIGMTPVYRRNWLVIMLNLILTQFFFGCFPPDICLNSSNYLQTKKQWKQDNPKTATVKKIVGIPKTQRIMTRRVEFWTRISFFPLLTPSPKLPINNMRNPPSSARPNKSNDIRNPKK